MHIFKNVHNGDISLEDIEKQQIKFKRNLINIKQGSPKNRSKEQQKTKNNATNLYNSRQEVVKMFIMLKTCLEIFMNQNKKERDLKY